MLTPLKQEASTFSCQETKSQNSENRWEDKASRTLQEEAVAEDSVVEHQAVASEAAALEDSVVDQAVASEAEALEDSEEEAVADSEEVNAEAEAVASEADTELLYSLNILNQLKFFCLHLST